MARPPVFYRKEKLEKNDLIEDYFRALVNEVNKKLKENNIRFNFSSYTTTIEEYAKLDIDDYDKAFKLARDFNEWYEYISDFAAYVEKLYLDAETDKIKIQSAASIKYNDSTVAKGDRKADIDEEVILARKDRNTLQAFHNLLLRKLDFLEKAHWHCKSAYDNAYNKAISQSKRVG